MLRYVNPKSHPGLNNTKTTKQWIHCSSITIAGKIFTHTRMKSVFKYLIQFDLTTVT